MTSSWIIVHGHTLPKRSPSPSRLRLTELREGRQCTRAYTHTFSLMHRFSYASGCGQQGSSSANSFYAGASRETLNVFLITVCAFRGQLIKPSDPGVGQFWVKPQAICCVTFGKQS